jgi:ABC-type polysaccharide/polyol phosphate export permease
MKANAAVADMILGSQAWRFWTLLGWNDVKQRYRRTVIGPFWITISMAVMISAIGIIYGSIFKVDLTNYLVYLAAGIVTWFFISSTLLEGMSAFITAEGIIKQSPIPFSIYIYRVIWRNLIVLLHNAVVVAVIVIGFQRFSLFLPLQLLLGLGLLIGNLFMMTLILAMIATRYRDLPPIVTNGLQVMFYITPILFDPAQLPEKMQIISHYNPFYHLVEVLRRPMIGQWADLLSYEVATGLLIVLGVFTIFLFRRCRSRIAYWL